MALAFLCYTIEIHKNTNIKRSSLINFSRFSFMLFSNVIKLKQIVEMLKTILVLFVYFIGCLFFY